MCVYMLWGVCMHVCVMCMFVYLLCSVWCGEYSVCVCCGMCGGGGIVWCVWRGIHVGGVVWCVWCACSHVCAHSGEQGPSSSETHGARVAEDLLLLAGAGRLVGAGGVGQEPSRKT